MADLQAILAPKPVEATVVFSEREGATLTFTYDAVKVTPAWFGQQDRALANGDLEGIAAAYSEVISSWDLTSGGAPVPVDAEILAHFPMGHLRLLMEAIADYPSSEEGNASAQPLSPPQPAASSDSIRQPDGLPVKPLNGATTSASPAPSASPSPT